MIKEVVIFYKNKKEVSFTMYVDLSLVPQKELETILELMYCGKELLYEVLMPISRYNR
jgi:hypothetical protein